PPSPPPSPAPALPPHPPPLPAPRHPPATSLRYRRAAYRSAPGWRANARFPPAAWRSPAPSASTPVDSLPPSSPPRAPAPPAPAARSPAPPADRPPPAPRALSRASAPPARSRHGSGTDRIAPSKYRHSYTVSAPGPNPAARAPPRWPHCP